MENLNFTLFETPGKKNTDATLKIAVKNAELLKIRTIIIASTTGTTIQAALEYFNPSIYRIICVTHNYYFRDTVRQEFPEELRESLEKQGVRVVSTTLAFSGVGSALLRKFQYFDGSALFSKLLRETMGQGLKVGMEMALMAVDNGHVETGEDVLTISGTGRGADTCCWITGASSRYFDKLRVKAIFAKPL
jgi:hypothetical protein